MGTIKDTNGRDLVDAEEIKITWNNCRKKVLMNQITMMVWSVTQNQIFCEIKRALESTAIIKLVDLIEFQ